MPYLSNQRGYGGQAGHGRLAELEALLGAIDRSQVVVEFAPDGKVLTANANFLKVMGYALDQVQGRHHSMFVDAAERDRPEYREFWARLARGEALAGDCRRVDAAGREVWFRAFYNPVLDPAGNVRKVVKVAAECTEEKRRTIDAEAQIAAVGRAQAVIEFLPDGTILDANENFLRTMGYRIEEIRGRHHSMFVRPEDRASEAYHRLWEALRRGEPQTGEFPRVGRDGKEIWILGSYNPVLDGNGKPCKVVKFAMDVTRQASARARNADNLRTIEGLAAATEEMSASIKEITRNMAASQQQTEQAVRNVQDAGSATTRLSDAAAAMNGIVDVITRIAGQITLLALNAAIESARAGEAGRGFAVVANEVKNLATQAKSATEQISKEIGNMTTVSREVVAALDSISRSVGDVSQLVNSTAAAVEQQSAVAHEMSGNMQRAAADSRMIHELLSSRDAA